MGTWNLIASFARRRHAVMALTAGLLALAAPQALAQPYSVFGPTSAPYTALASGTNTGITSSTSSATVNLPFKFAFFGTEQTSVNVSRYGYLTFDSDAADSGNTGIPHNTASNKPTILIAAWWDSQYPNTSSRVRYGTIGAVPNRIFVVEWAGMCISSSSCSAPFSYQVQLYEGSNKIRVHYGSGNATTTASVGIMGGLGVGTAGLSCTTASSGGCSSFPTSQYLEYALPPDLQLKSVSVEDVGYAGVSFQGSAVVSNSGGLPANNNVKVRFYLSTDITLETATDKPLGESNPTSVDVNSQATVTATLTVPATEQPGNFFLLAMVDPDGMVAEGAAKEGNNVSPPIPFRIGPPSPDLTVGTVAAPATPPPGQPMTVQRLVRNVGNADATTSFTSTYFVSDNSVVTISDRAVGTFTLGGVTGGGADNGSDQVTLPSNLPGGRYWIGLCVDFEVGGGQAGSVTEISEVNNCVTGNAFILNTGALTVLTTSLPAATQNGPYGLRLEATGGNGSYAWSLQSGALPPGLTLDAQGLLSGTPSAPGDHAFTVKVVSAGAEQTQALTLTVQPQDLPLAIVDQELPPAEFNRQYQHQLVATGGKPGYTWTLKSPSVLPDGLGLSTDGFIEGRPSRALDAPHVFTVEIEDQAGTRAVKDLTLRVLGPSSLQIATTGLQTGYLDQAYNQPLVAVGGSGSYSWTVVKFQKLAQSPTEVPGPEETSIPEGFGISPVVTGSTAALRGTPQQAGLYALTLYTQDTLLGTEDITTLPLLISYERGLAITTTTLPDAFIGKAYSARLSTNAAPAVAVTFAPACVQQASSAGGGFTYSCVTGDALQAVPAGLSLAADGSITGVATAEGGDPATYSFLVQATDAQGRSDVRSVSIKVRPAIVFEEGCSGTGAGPAMLALFGLAGLWIRRRRA